MKNIVIILLTSAIFLTDTRPAFPQFQGANSGELCCYIIFFPIIYPFSKLQRWWGSRPVTYRLGDNTIKFVRRTVFFDLYETSRIVSGELFEDMMLSVGDRKLVFKRDYMHFHANGAIEKGNMLEMTEFVLMDQPVKIAPGEVTFFDDGIFKSGTLAETVFLMVNGKRIGFAGGSPIHMKKID